MRECIFVAGFALVALSVPAYGQQPPSPQQPRAGDRALFGSGTGRFDQILSINSNVGLSWYERLGEPFVDEDGVVTPDKTWLGLTSASLGYLLNIPALSVSASLGGFSNYYPPPTSRWFSGLTSFVSANSGRSWALSPKTTLSAGASLGFLPTYWSTAGTNFLINPDDPSSILPPDVTNLPGQTLDAASSVGLTHSLTRRVSLGANYGYARTWTFGRDEAFDILTHTASATVGVEITRHLRGRGGYRFGASRVGDADAPYLRTHGVDAGLDYGRGGTIRLSRNTTLSFNGGAAAAIDGSGDTHYFLIGGARLDHDIGRTWRTGVGYRRDLQFFTLLADPILSDNVYSDLSGLINTRLSFTAAATYSRGAVGFAGGENAFNRANVFVGLQSAINRYMAFNVNYSYYYRFAGSDVDLPSDLSPHSESQQVNVFLSAWAPLYSRVRRPDATR
jgi:hypothetical protein